MFFNYDCLKDLFLIFVEIFFRIQKKLILLSIQVLISFSFSKYSIFISVGNPRGVRARARLTLWVLRVFTPGFVALEPAIRAEMVVEEQEYQDRLAGSLNPHNPTDPTSSDR